MADDRTKDIIEQLENGIKDTLNSQKYKEFLRVQSMFHAYSFNNAMLIFVQKPDATRVAGYKTWQKLERQVMKGEKGITILAPSATQYRKLVDKIDPNTGLPEKDPATGEIIKIKEPAKVLSFRPVSVFDISQTDGKELPDICSELLGDSKAAEKIINAIKSISSVPVVELPISDGSKGFYSRSENVIALKEGMSLDQTAKTLVHEYAHSLLHNADAAALMDRATKEVQAESVAFIVSNRYGLDTSDYSFEYLAAWSSGKELKELKTSFDLIQKTANKIIEDMDKALQPDKELQQGALDQVVAQYAGEYPAIKHITEETASAIKEINEAQGTPLSLKNIKQTHQRLGKQLEANGQDKDALQLFERLDGVMDGLKRAQLAEKQTMAKECARSIAHGEVALE